MVSTDAKSPLNPSGEIILCNYLIAHSPMKSVDVLGEFIKSCTKKRIQTGYYYIVLSNSWLHVERDFLS